jgi:hypothetical protein
LYSFAGLGAVPVVFSGKIRRENALRMHSAQPDALLRHDHDFEENPFDKDEMDYRMLSSEFASLSP